MERQRIQSNDSAASNAESLAFSHLSGLGGEDMLRRQSSNSAFHASPSLAQNMSIFDSAAYSGFPDSPGSSVWNHTRRTSSVGFDSEAMRHVGSVGAASSRYGGDESPADSAAMSVTDSRNNSMSERSLSHISNDSFRGGVTSSPLARNFPPRATEQGAADDGAGSDGSDYDEEHDAAVRAAAMDEYNVEAERRHRNLGLNFITPFDSQDPHAEQVRTPGAAQETDASEIFINANDVPAVPKRGSSFGRKGSDGSSPEKASPRTPHANLVGLPASPSKSARMLAEQQPQPRSRGLSDAATPRVLASTLPDESRRGSGPPRGFQAGPTVRPPASRDVPVYPGSPPEETSAIQDGKLASSTTSPTKASSPLAAEMPTDADLDPASAAALEAQLTRAADAADPSRPRTLKEARALAKERSKLRQMAGGGSSSSHGVTSPSSTTDSRPGTARPVSAGTATGGSRPESRDEASTPTIGHEGSGGFFSGHRSKLSSSSHHSSTAAPALAPVRSSSPVKGERPARDPKRAIPSINTGAAPPPRISTSSDRSDSDYSKSSASDAILTPMAPEGGGLLGHSRADNESEAAEELVDDEGEDEDPTRLSAQRRAKRYGQVSPRMGGNSDLPSGPRQMDELQAAVGDALADLSFGSSTTATGETAMPPSTILGEAAIEARQRNNAPPTALDTPRLAQMMTGLSVAREGSPGTDGASRADTSFDSARESLPAGEGAIEATAQLQGPDLAAVVYSPDTVAPSPRATPRTGSYNTDTAAPQITAKPTIYGKTARWPAAFDPAPIVNKRKAAPWDRAKAYAMAANELVRTDTCLQTWLLCVQRPAQTQLQRQGRGGAGGAKGWHAKEGTDASYAASVRSDATFPVRGDGGKAREVTHLASLSEDQPVSSLPSNMPYPGVVAAASQNMAPSSSQSSFYTATSGGTALPTNSMSRGASGAGGGSGGGGFFSSLGRKGSKKSPSSGPLGMSSLSSSSSQPSIAGASAGSQQPRGPRGVKSRTISSPIAHGHSPSMGTAPLPSLDVSPANNGAEVYVQESPTSITQPSNPPISSASSIARANSMAAEQQEGGGHSGSATASGGTLRAPMGPRPQMGMGSPSGASSASYYSTAPASRRDSTSSALSAAGSSNHGGGGGGSGLGGDEKKGTFFGVTSGGGIYSTPRAARSESREGQGASFLAPGMSSTTSGNGSSPTLAPTDYKKESAFDGRRRGSSSNRGGASPRPSEGASLQPGNATWDTDPPSREQPSRSPTITRSSLSYGSVRTTNTTTSRSPALSVATMAGGTGAGGLKIPSPGGGSGASGSGGGLGLGLVGHKLVGKRSGSFSSQGGPGGSSPSESASPVDAGFEEALSKLGDVLPDADSATLRYYLKKAGGNDLAAIGDYLQDQSLGKIVNPNHGAGGGAGGTGNGGGRGKAGLGWR